VAVAADKKQTRYDALAGNGETTLVANGYKRAFQMLARCDSPSRTIRDDPYLISCQDCLLSGEKALTCLRSMTTSRSNISIELAFNSFTDIGLSAS